MSEASLATATQATEHVTPSYVDYELLPIPTHKQRETKWCWAASSEMVIDHLGGNETQEDIVKYVKGSLINQGADDREVQRGLRWAGLASTIELDVVPFRTLTKQIKRNQPLLAHILWNSTKTGHMLVIRGYKEDTDNGLWSVYYKDPDPYAITDNIARYGEFRDSKKFSWYSTLHEIYVR